jgi:hypothetical protein
MKYLIQTMNGIVKHDFSFTLMKSCEYQNWLNRDKSFIYVLTDELMLSEYIPIGSIEYVSKYLLEKYNIAIKPKNIPVELMKSEFTLRNVINGTEKDIKGKKFVKSNDKIKLFTEICTTAPPGNYQISDIIEIDSEWRAFVYNNKLVGLQNYSGEFDKFPNVEIIKQMIQEYKSAPIAYTLDVGIFNDKTFIIEVHDFFSCGLYGFANHKILPFMFSDWFNQFIIRLTYDLS